ncbi:hypothetical protein OJAV_G00000460 [Oryzias javanicus]|uniref:Uncharacterized protein n=1 Tax=Oryzias javanicus TaxID=123683 RepID=A0A3S2N713_ORYJA|nr:hypothetical protein OJAV_G00000460 [Oryzias javanicus]
MLRAFSALKRNKRMERLKARSPQHIWAQTPGNYETDVTHGHTAQRENVDGNGGRAPARRAFPSELDVFHATGHSGARGSEETTAGEAAERRDAGNAVSAEEEEGGEEERRRGGEEERRRGGEGTGDLTALLLPA